MSTSSKLLIFLGAILALIGVSLSFYLFFVSENMFLFGKDVKMEEIYSNNAVRGEMLVVYKLKEKLNSDELLELSNYPADNGLASRDGYTLEKWKKYLPEDSLNHAFRDVNPSTNAKFASESDVWSYLKHSADNEKLRMCRWYKGSNYMNEFRVYFLDEDRQILVRWEFYD